MQRYLAQNPEFTLEIHNFAPRWVEPQPLYEPKHRILSARAPSYTVSKTRITRGRNNHIKDIVVKPGESITEESKTWKPTGEKYVTLQTKSWRRTLGDSKPGVDPVRKAGGLKLVDERDIVYIPILS